MSHEDLFKLADTAAPAEDRILPAQRIYLKSSKTIDINGAISLLKQRREHRAPVLAGGLDDESDKMRRKIESRPSLEASDMTAESSRPTAGYRLEDAIKAVDSGEIGEECGETSSEPEKVKRRPARQTTSELMKGICIVQHQVDSLSRLVIEKSEELKGLKEDKALDLPDEKNSGKDRLSVLKSESHRVTYIVNGMEFTVRCLKLMRDGNCLVLAFDADGDSFFTPPVRSELKIRYDGEESGTLYYFGMSFTLADLGMRFLGFLETPDLDSGVDGN